MVNYVCSWSRSVSSYSWRWELSSWTGRLSRRGACPISTRSWNWKRRETRSVWMEGPNRTQTDGSHVQPWQTETIQLVLKFFTPPCKLLLSVFVHLLTRLCVVVTACSWSTLTVCWIRTVCVNALQSCRPTWSSSRGSWRGSGRGRGAGSKWSRAASVCTVWVDTAEYSKLEVQHCLSTATTEHFIHILFPVCSPQSHLSLCSEDQCYGPCCSLDLDLRPQANSNRLLLRKVSAGIHLHGLLTFK